VNKTVVYARTEIFKDYPAYTVITLENTDPMPSADHLTRFIVLTDGNGIVTNVVFNRIECPAESPIETGNSGCSNAYQNCAYTYDTHISITGNTCTTMKTDECTCDSISYEWICEEEIGCQ
jgi:putative ribosome biogenesis GTPase RsgA